MNKADSERLDSALGQMGLSPINSPQDADVIVLGFPVNLLYHAVLSVLLSFVMWLIILKAWPSYLDKD